MNKCVVNGKTVYQEAACPQGSVQKPMAAGAAGPSGAATLPAIQAGLWQVSEPGASPRQICGDPLRDMALELEMAAETRRLGCTVDVMSPGPRSVAVLVNCPNRNSKGGGRFEAGKSGYTVISPTPQSYSVEMLYPDGRRRITNGVRFGNC